MKPTSIAVIILVVFALLVGMVAVRADDPTTQLEWDSNDPSDKVIEYVVAFRPRGNATNVFAWTEVTVKASPTPSAVLPVSPFGTEFRVAALNNFGRSPWTETFFLPSAARGLRIILPISP